MCLALCCSFSPSHSLLSLSLLLPCVPGCHSQSPVCPLNFPSSTRTMAREKKFCVSTASFTSLPVQFSFAPFHYACVPLSSLSLSPFLYLPPFDLLWLRLGESFDFSLWLFYDSLSTVFGSRTENFWHTAKLRAECPGPHRVSFFSLSLYLSSFAVPVPHLNGKGKLWVHSECPVCVLVNISLNSQFQFDRLQTVFEFNDFCLLSQLYWTNGTSLFRNSLAHFVNRN